MKYRKCISLTEDRILNTTKYESSKCDKIETQLLPKLFTKPKLNKINQVSNKKIVIKQPIVIKM